MANTSPARVKATAIQQVCIVVNDLQETMEAYWNILGIDPWAVVDFGFLRITTLLKLMTLITDFSNLAPNFWTYFPLIRH